MADRDKPTAPWTIKGMPIATRELVIRCARQDGVSVAAWMARAAENEAHRVGAVPMPTRTTTPLDLMGVAALLQAVAQVQMAGIPVTRGAVRETLAVVRRHMRETQGKPVGRIGQTIALSAMPDPAATR